MAIRPTPGNSSRPVGASSTSTRNPFRPTTVPASGKASSVWSTKASPARPISGVRCVAWGVGCRARPGLPGDRPRCRREACRHRRCLALRKAALVTMAFDQRFAMVLVGSSGKGGATPLRRNFGEAVESLASDGEYHWMAGNFLKYAAADATFGRQNAGRPSGGLERTHRSVCTPSHIHQLRHPRKRRCPVARPTRQLHGHRRSRPRFQTPRRQRHRRKRGLSHRQNASRQRRFARRPTCLATG